MAKSTGVLADAMELSTIDNTTLWTIVSCSPIVPTDAAVTEVATHENCSISNIASLGDDPVVSPNDPASVSGVR